MCDFETFISKLSMFLLQYKIAIQRVILISNLEDFKTLKPFFLLFCHSLVSGKIMYLLILFAWYCKFWLCVCGKFDLMDVFIMIEGQITTNTHRYFTVPGSKEGWSHNYPTDQTRAKPYVKKVCFWPFNPGNSSFLAHYNHKK